MEKPNPSNAPETQITPATRRRIPMSTPMRKLEVPEIPGYHLHWFLDSNVPRAIQGGYEVVHDDETSINQLNIGADKLVNGSMDLGSMIRIVGGIAENGKPECLTLMKIKEEYWREDQVTLETRNAQIMAGIFKDEKIMDGELNPGDKSQRYVKTALFQRPKRKG